MERDNKRHKPLPPRQDFAGVNSARQLRNMLREEYKELFPLDNDEAVERLLTVFKHWLMDQQHEARSMRLDLEQQKAIGKLLQALNS